MVERILLSQKQLYIFVLENLELTNLLSATDAAMIRLRSTTRRQLRHPQSLQRQNRLCPFRHDTTPCTRQREHLGFLNCLRVLLVTPTGDNVSILKRKKLR